MTSRPSPSSAASRWASRPKDLEGKVLGAPPPDGAWAQFPAFAAANDLDVDAITVEPVGFPTREPMLAEGKVAAITGFSFSSVPEPRAPRRAGGRHLDHPDGRLRLALYGNAIIVNTDFAAENPEVVTGFLRAVAKGWKDVIADPAAGSPA
jgi:NitT/TauT family transport system substrate-binding protein